MVPLDVMMPFEVFLVVVPFDMFLVFLYIVAMMMRNVGSLGYGIGGEGHREQKSNCR